MIWKKKKLYDLSTISRYLEKKIDLQSLNIKITNYKNYFSGEIFKYGGKVNRSNDTDLTKSIWFLEMVEKWV